MSLSPNSNPETNLLNAILPYLPYKGQFNIADILITNPNIDYKAFPEFILLDSPENQMPLDAVVKLKLTFRQNTSRALADTLDRYGYIDRPTGKLELTEKGRRLKEAGSYNEYLLLLENDKRKEQLKDDLLKSDIDVNQVTIEASKSVIEVNKSILETNKSVRTTNRLQKWSLIVTGIAIIGTFVFSWLTYINNVPLEVRRVDMVVLVKYLSLQLKDSTKTKKNLK